MSTARTYGIGTDRVVPLRSRGCGFPECAKAPVTSAGMCDLHRRVSVSTTGSWLEVG